MPRALARQSRVLTSIPEVDNQEPETDAPVPPAPSPVAAVEPEPAPEVPQRTPARQRLADAIATVRGLEEEVAQASAALSEAQDRQSEAWAALRAAEAGLERARPALGMSHLRPREAHSFRTQEEAEAYQVLLDTPPPSIEEAKAEVTRATDASDSARAAVQYHERRQRQAADSLSYKRSYIDDALRLVVHYDPALAALAAECKRLATASAAARQAFNMAVGTDLLQPSHAFYGSTRPTDFREDPEGWAVVHRWRAAMEALKTDPDAPLPAA